MILQQSSVQVDEKPPSKTSLDFGARIVSAIGFVVGRLALCRSVLSSDWRVCPTRNPLYGRRILVSKDF